MAQAVRMAVVPLPPQSVSLMWQRYEIPIPLIVRIMRTHTLRCNKHKKIVPN